MQSSEPFTIMPADAIIRMWGFPLHQLISSVMTTTSEKDTFKYPVLLVTRDRRLGRHKDDATTARSKQIGEKRKAPDNDASLQLQMARGTLAQDAAPAPTLLQQPGT